MVVIAVFAILLTIAFPSFDTLIKNSRLATASSEVQTALGLARAEAVTRRQTVSVCPSTDGSTCNATDWQSGLIVYTAGGTGGANQILKYLQLSGAVRVNPATITTAINFAPAGTTGNAGNLTFCDTRPAGNYGRQLQIFPTGRVEATRQAACS